MKQVPLSRLSTKYKEACLVIFYNLLQGYLSASLYSEACSLLESVSGNKDVFPTAGELKKFLEMPFYDLFEKMAIGDEQSYNQFIFFLKSEEDIRVSRIVNVFLKACQNSNSLQKQELLKYVEKMTDEVQENIRVADFLSQCKAALKLR